MSPTASEKTTSPDSIPSISAEEQAAIALTSETKEHFGLLLNSIGHSFQEFLAIMTGQNPFTESPQDVPVWIQNSAARIRRNFFPTLKQGEDPDSPFYNGKLLGHFNYLVNSPEVLSAIFQSESPNSNEAMQALIDNMNSMVNLSINESLKSPLEIQQEFFKGFGLALSKPSDFSDVINSSSSFMAEFMMIAGRHQISKMTSTEQLHDWLETNLGHNLAGSLARTQKLCQRIGLKLGPKGRPRKNNRTTT